MPKALDKFQEALNKYAVTVSAKFKALDLIEGQQEAQLVAPVETLLKAAELVIDKPIGITNESAVAEQKSRPDFAVSSAGLLRGHAELKAPGKGASPNKFTDAHDRAQWKKFKNLPNILYTDGTAWALYQEGNDVPVASIVLGGDITTEGSKAITAENTASLVALFGRFFRWDPIAPSSPKDLAVGLAKLCHYLRDDVELAIADPDSNLSEVMREWRARLFPDADEKRFADAYAQTVAYALLLARSRGLNDKDISKAIEVLEPAHGLLGQALNVLTQPGAISEVKPAVDILFRYILAVDMSVFEKMHGEPWLYFYEDFLAEYDPALRKDFGVYYTPAEVVKAQTALVSALLLDKYDRKLGFADDKVSILDPGVGTATYLLGVIERGVQSALSFGGKGYVSERASVMADNIYGFEWLVGPYAVAHLRLSEELKLHGANLPAGGAHVYLTDTLESPNATPPFVAGLFGKKLSDEHKKALTVKSPDIPILVCIGNPPYDRHSASVAVERGGWIRFGDGQKGEEVPLNAFIEPVVKAGRGGDLKNLYNSYVYFWRWALWKVFEQVDAPGIVSFITASSYLRGPAFLGMREHMRRIFDELWIIDLGGDNLGPRKTPNVFAIQTPVAIAIGARYGKPEPETPATVHYVSLVEGTREEKLARLADINDFTGLPWEPAMPSWQEPLLPQRDGVYWSWPLLIDLFPWQHSGVEMKRTWVIAPDKHSLARRWEKLITANKNIQKQYFIETDYRGVSSSVKDLEGKPLAEIEKLTAGEACPEPARYSFRSLDRQWILADNRMGDRLRPALWHVDGPSQVYLTSLITTVMGSGPSAVVCANVPDRHHFRGSFGGKDVIPLWRDSSAKQSNITKGLLEELEKAFGIPVSPEDFLAYCYAVLAAPDYADRYSEDLSVPGPRIPVTRDAGLFTKAVETGRHLIALHTYGERFIHSEIPQGKARIEKAIDPASMPEKYDYIETEATLYLGGGEVKPVYRAVWEFSVSGYTILQRWLDFRMAKGAGKQSSELDRTRPETWPPEWTTELLELIWVLEATVDLLPETGKMFGEIIAGHCFEAEELPTPAEEEKKPPKVPTAAAEQGTLFGD